MPGIDPTSEPSSGSSPYRAPRLEIREEAPREPYDPELGDVTEARTRMDLLLGAAMLVGAVGIVVVSLALDTLPLVVLVVAVVLAFSGVLRFFRGIGGLLPARSRDD